MVNYKYVRTNYMKDIKEFIKVNYSLGIENIDNSTIPSHALDAAIKLACSSYKTAIANLLNGKIKRFRIKCRNLNGSNQLMEIESQYFNQDGNVYNICNNILGRMDYVYNNEQYFLTKNRTSIIHFNGYKYRLLMPIKIDEIDNGVNQKQVFLGSDPGIRVFQTCITNNEMVKYGTNAYPIISSYLRKIDKLTNNNTKDSQILIPCLRKKCYNFLLKYINIIF